VKALVKGERLTITSAISSLAILIAPISGHTAEAATASVTTPVEVIESLEGTFGVHQGQRRNHAKGTCAVGEFVATAGAPALSRSQLFSGALNPVVARFSVAGGNPSVPGATKNARGDGTGIATSGWKSAAHDYAQYAGIWRSQSQFVQ
jgi:hypothetical protein